MIIDAANTMFNQSNTQVVIRLPQAGDKEIKPASPAQIPSPAPTPSPEQGSSGDAEQQQITDPTPKEEKSPEIEAQEKTNEKREETDQEKMVLELFDGKYIE